MTRAAATPFPETSAIERPRSPDGSSMKSYESPPTSKQATLVAAISVPGISRGGCGEKPLLNLLPERQLARHPVLLEEAQVERRVLHPDRDVLGDEREEVEVGRAELPVPLFRSCSTPTIRPFAVPDRHAEDRARLEPRPAIRRRVEPRVRRRVVHDDRLPRRRHGPGDPLPHRQADLGDLPLRRDPRPDLLLRVVHEEERPPLHAELLPRDRDDRREENRRLDGRVDQLRRLDEDAEPLELAELGGRGGGRSVGVGHGAGG